MGIWITIQAAFRAYNGYEENFEDYAKLMKEGIVGNPHFYEGVWKSNAKTYHEATKFLTGKYATDTTYNKKLDVLIEVVLQSLFLIQKIEKLEKIKIQKDW